MADAMREAFDRWYADQRHQLSNEVVCRVIWERAWCTAVQQPAQGEPFATVDGGFLDRVLAAAKPAQGEPMGWYCAHCQQGVDPSEVTFNEAHTVCGRIITHDAAPPAPSVSVPDEMWAGPPHTVDYVNGWNACRDAMLASGGKASLPDALRESYGCNPSYINGWNPCRAAMLAAAAPEVKS